MTDREDTKILEHRAYSRGYNTGKATSARESKEALRKKDKEIAELRQQLGSAKLWPQGKDEEIIRCITVELKRAIAEKRLHLWEKCAHALIDFIVFQYQQPAASPLSDQEQE